MDIKRNISEFKTRLVKQNVTLVAVSKTKPAEAILTAYEAGHLDFGENKVQELVTKEAELPKDIRWHMIGHLQRNKVKYIARFVHLIHGVDSLRLLRAINKEGKKNDRRIPCLLQVHIAKESTKFGMSKEEVQEAIQEAETLPFVEIRGLMGMATLTDDRAVIRGEFDELHSLFIEIKSEDHPGVTMEILSMGMSGDYNIAIEAGSTMVRIGSAIFGSRS